MNEIIGGKVSPYINVWTVLGAICILITITLALVFAFNSSYKDKKMPSIHVWGFTAIVGGLVSLMMIASGIMRGRHSFSQTKDDLRSNRFGYNRRRVAPEIEDNEGSLV